MEEGVWKSPGPRSLSPYGHPYQKEGRKAFSLALQDLMWYDKKKPGSAVSLATY
jgi:hypothetical protein